MKYTVSGIANIFMTDMEQSEADETLSLLKRRGGFEAEYSGLFNPALIDKFYTTQDGTRISWHRKNNGDLNAEKPSLDAIHSRKDFLHEASSGGTTYSVNAKCIALVQELSDGILYFATRGTPVKLPGVGTFTPSIDKEGHVQINFRADMALKNGANAPGATAQSATRAASGWTTPGTKNFGTPIIPKTRWKGKFAI